MNINNIAGVIVAGGAASRMGFRDKPLLLLRGRTILSHIVDRASSQVSTLLLNVNRNVEAYRGCGLPLISDTCSSGVPGGAGPLAGILAAMQWMEHANSQDRSHPLTHLACFPGDTPCFPAGIVSLLSAALQQDDPRISWLQTDGQLQPLFSVWPLTLQPRLREALAGGVYSPRYFIEAHDNLLVSMSSPEPGMFFNINDPEALVQAEAIQGQR